MSTSRKTQAEVDTTAQSTTKTVASTSQPSASHFPISQYASVLSLHLSLVVLTALYLPRTMRRFGPPTTGEMEKPQSELMEALTADPFSTLCWVSAGLMPLQVWWANWVRNWSYEQTSGTKITRDKFDALRYTAFKDAVTSTLGATLMTHVTVVVFGASITTHALQTVLFAFVIATLTAFTPAFVFGPPTLASGSSWRQLLSPKDPIGYAIAYPTWGTFIGAWLCVIPIALDWDRPWQAWPLMPLFGGLGGYYAGALTGFVVIAAKWFVAKISDRD